MVRLTALSLKFSLKCSRRPVNEAHPKSFSVEIVKRSDQASGFVVLPMRWVVERTLAWLNRCRRLAKDFKASAEMRGHFLQFALHQSA